MTDDKFFAVRFVVALVIIVGIIYLGMFAEKEYPVVVENSWWESSTAVRYSSYECGPSTDFKGNMSIECDWETHTRCRNSMVGSSPTYEWPATTCEPRSSDRIEHSIRFFIQYHEEEQKKSNVSAVSEQAWKRAQDGTSFVLVKDGVGLFVKDLR